MLYSIGIVLFVMGQIEGIVMCEYSSRIVGTYHIYVDTFDSAKPTVGSYKHLLYDLLPAGKNDKG